MAISETTLFLRLPKILKRKIQAEAKRKHLSANALIRLALGEWLEQQTLKHRLEKGAK